MTLVRKKTRVLKETTDDVPGKEIEGKEDAKTL